MNRSARLAAALLTGLLFAATALAEPEPHTLTVTGHGEVRAQPDQATVTIGVSTRAPTVAAAGAAIDKVMPALLKLTHDLAIPDAQVRSTRISIHPEYADNDKGTDRHFSAYVAERAMVVDLRDIDRLAELLERSASAGANLISEPELDSSRRSELERTALARALGDAQENARVLASAAGASVGPALRIDMSGTGPTRLRDYAGVSLGMNGRGAAADSFQLGELTFRASLEATFGLVPVPAAR